MLPKLYGYDTKGKVKVWWVTTDSADVTVHHGAEGGKITEKTTTSKAKNVGRANETTPAEQAIKDAQSKWNKQKDKNYHEDIANAEQLENPMLAQDFRKQGHRITYPCSVQPKLDGVRCFVKLLEDGTMLWKSRGNKEYPLIKEVADELRQVFDAFVEPHKTFIDGELYYHGESLQNIVSAVKKHIDDEGNFKDLTGKIEFHMFDYFNAGDPLCNAETRMHDLMLLEGRKQLGLKRVVFVLPEPCDSEAQLKNFHDVYRLKGYEGVMARNLKGVYKLNGRSPDLQKYKEFVDEEFLCVDVFIDKDGFGVPVLENLRWKEGQDEKFKTFKATWKGTHEARKYIADNPHTVVGKQITVQYQALTDAGLPQFPVAVAVRDYE